MLKRLYADNFRCLTNFTLEPGRVAVLAGPNGGGKSSVFEVLQMLQALLGPAGAAVQDVFSPLTLTRWDNRSRQRIEVEIEAERGSLYHYAIEVNHDITNRQVFIAEERVSSDDQVLYRLVDGEVQLFGDEPTGVPRTRFPIDPRRSFLPLLQPRPDNKRITAFKSWFERVFLFKLRPETIDPVSPEESTAIAIDGRNFVSWLRSLLLERPFIAETVRAAIFPTIPGLRSITLSRGGERNRWLSLGCELGGTSFALSFNELSEGQKILLVLYTILDAIPEYASLLVFDEPDNFMADSEIQPWLSALRDRVVNSATGSLLVISHHPEVINYLATDQVLRIWRDSTGFSRLDPLDIDREAGVTAADWLKLDANA